MANAREKVTITPKDVGVLSCCVAPPATLSPLIEAKWKEGKLTPEEILSVLSHLAKNEATEREVLRTVGQIQNLAPCSLGIFGSGFFAAALANANTLLLAHDIYSGQKCDPPETFVHVPNSKDFSAFVGHFPPGTKFLYWESPNVPGVAIEVVPKKPFDVAVVLNPSPIALEMAWEQSADDGFVMVLTTGPTEAEAVMAALGDPQARVDGLMLWPGRIRRLPVKFSS